MDLETSVITFRSLSSTAITSAHDISQLKVPLYADPRRAAELSCHFKMDEQKLHSVKWYRDTNEIFRYNPTQQVRLFPSLVLQRTQFCFKVTFRFCGTVELVYFLRMFSLYKMVVVVLQTIFILCAGRYYLLLESLCYSGCYNIGYIKIRVFIVFLTSVWVLSYLLPINQIQCHH